MFLGCQAVSCFSQFSATLCVSIRGGSIFSLPGWLLYAVFVKIVPPSVSQSGVTVFQVTRMATVCCVSQDSATLYVAIRGDSV